MESTRTITAVCTVLELDPFKHLMEETGFSVKVFKQRERLQCIHALIEPCTLA